MSPTQTPASELAAAVQNGATDTARLRGQDLSPWEIAALCQALDDAMEKFAGDAPSWQHKCITDLHHRISTATRVRVFTKGEA